MSFNIHIWKPGTYPSLDPDDLEFSSLWDTLKYESQGIVNMEVDLANYYQFNPGVPPIIPDTYLNYQVFEVEHNLGYYPDFAGYYFPSGVTAIQCPFGFGDAGFFSYLSVYADDNKLYFIVDFNSINNTGIVDFEFAYRIFKNDLGL